MPESPGGYTLSLTADERHDRLCDRFEAGWRADAPPRIEDLLPEVPEDERPALLFQLLRIDLERRAGDPAAVADLRARFPAFAALIPSAPADPDGTGAYPGAATDPTPPTIPGYEVNGSLGSGGMGVVFRARHVGLGRAVAIKMVRAGVCDRPGQLARFHLEARAVAALSHPHVVPLYDFGHADGRPYLVMELVEGGSLADRLDGTAADPAWAAGLVEQLARAVHHIHRNRIVHRDLKPANVLLAADGTPKITDFGLAKQLAADDPGLTEPYAVLGTACYMSPEQARGDAKNVGPAADVYALGGILYECLTGRPPFRAATYALTVAQVLTDDPPRPADLVAGLSADLEAVCLKCLEKEPDRRYPTAEALADDLRAFLTGSPVTARPLSPADVHARWARKVGYELGEAVGPLAYRARHAALGRTVLLKLAAGPARAGLRREAEALAGLNHPNVIRLYDYAEQSGQAVLVLEEVEGGESLADGLPEPTGRVAAVGMMLALGLQAVHANGFLHGGLWPGAVVVARDGTAKLGEFGAARRRDQPAGPAPDGVPVAFQAPEVRAGAWDRVGPAADVYALGAVLHELLWGESPPADGPRPDPTALGAVVHKCLAPDPADRYPSAAALLLALQLARGSGDSSVNSDGTILTDPAAAPDRSARYRLRVAGGPGRVGDTFPVPRSRLMVGRAKESTVRLPGRRVSRPHCAILWDEEAGCHEVVDLGSYNGTFVNAQPVRGRRRLTPGDRLRVADYELAFEPLPAG